MSHNQQESGHSGSMHSVLGGDKHSFSKSGDTVNQLSGTMDHIYMKFKEQQASGGGTSLLERQLNQGGQQHGQTHQSIGLADKHFKPIEIEAKKIKEQQRSNLSKFCGSVTHI